MTDTRVNDEADADAMLSVTCPHCGRKNKTRRKHIGMTGRCKCGQTFIIAEEHTATCRHCGQLVEADAKTCPACGRDPSEIAEGSNADRHGPGQSGPNGRSRIMSRLTRCPTCGGQVSKAAARCPHCGEPRREFSWQRVAVAVAIVLVVGVICCGGFDGCPVSESTSSWDDGGVAQRNAKFEAQQARKAAEAERDNGFALILRLMTEGGYISDVDHSARQASFDLTKWYELSWDEKRDVVRGFSYYFARWNDSTDRCRCMIFAPDSADVLGEYSPRRGVQVYR